MDMLGLFCHEFSCTASVTNFHEKGETIQLKLVKIRGIRGKKAA